MKRTDLSALIIAFVLLASTAVAGQREQSQPAPTGLALEIVFLKNQPAALMTTPDFTQEHECVISAAIFNDTDALLKEFPELHPNVQSRIAPSLKTAMQWLKKGMIEDIEGFERVRTVPLTRPELQAWLLKTSAKYEQWHSRL